MLTEDQLVKVLAELGRQTAASIHTTVADVARRTGRAKSTAYAAAHRIGVGPGPLTDADEARLVAALTERPWTLGRLARELGVTWPRARRRADALGVPRGELLPHHLAQLREALAH
jgi:hypothetical protein